MKITCSSCGESYRVKDSWTGNFECMKCRNMISVIHKQPLTPQSAMSHVLTELNKREDYMIPFQGKKQKNDQNLIFCVDCGKKVSRNAPYCPHCGTPVNPVKQPEKQTQSAFFKTINFLSDIFMLIGCLILLWVCYLFFNKIVL